MKKTFIMILAAVMSVCLAACAGTSVPGENDPQGESAEPTNVIVTVSAEPTASPEPMITELPTEEPTAAPVIEQPEAYTPVEITSALPYTCDLDGDGAADVVDFAPENTEPDAIYRLSVTFGGTRSVYAMDTDIIIDDFQIWLCNMNGDELPELYLCGGCGDDYYVTYAWSYQGGEFKPVTFSGESRADANSDGSYFFGYIELFDGTIFKMGGVVNILGTYGAYRPYEYKADGTIGPLDDSLWAIDNNEMAIKTIRELPVSWIDEGGETKGTLAVGTSIYVTATDGQNSVWFTDENGNNGRIEVERAEDDFISYIDGVAEYDCFEELPYAG